MVQLTPQDFLQAVDHEVRMRRWRAQSDGEYSVHELVIPLEIDLAVLRWYLLTYTPDSYLLWHPSHLAHEREATQPERGRRFIVWEWINGRLQADRMWGGAPLELCPITPANPERTVLTTVFDTDSEPFRHILIELEPDGDGVISRGTWTFPAATPEDYIEGLLNHCREERVGMVENAIPYAIKRHFGYMPTTDQVREELALQGIGEVEGSTLAAPGAEEVSLVRERLAGLLEHNGWEALVIAGPENGQHASGWDMEIVRYWPDRPLITVVLRTGETVLVVWQEMVKMGKRPGPFANDLAGYWRGGDGPKTAGEAVVAVLREHGVASGAVGLEKSRASIVFFERLSADLPDVEWVAADDELALLRMVKQPRELEALRSAAQRADSAFWSAVEDARPGDSELELAGRIRASAAEHGCLVTMLTVCAGERACAVNEPTGRPIVDGDIIRIDFNMRYGAFHLDDVYYGGYFADIGRMAVMGQPSQEQVDAYRDQVELKQRIIDFVRPGRTASEVYAHYRSCADEMGVTLFLLPSIGVGHGIGIVNDEAPRLTAADDTVIEAGMALALEPDTIGPGNALMHVEDVVAVSDEGAELISWSRDWSELPVLGT